MQNTRLALGALALAVSLTGCSIPGTEYKAEPIGGADHEGAGDEIHFDLSNDAELGSGHFVLDLPPDWPDRPRWYDEDGILELAELIEPTWVRASVPRPPIEMAEMKYSFLAATSVVTDETSQPFLTVYDYCPEPEDIDRIEALLTSADGYHVFRAQSDPIIVYRIYGTVRGEGGDPDSLSLVRLSSVHFVDGRSDLQWLLSNETFMLAAFIGVLLLLPLDAVSELWDRDTT